MSFISKCCRASMHVSTSDEGTSFYICDACEKPTDRSPIFLLDKSKQNNMMKVTMFDTKKIKHLSKERMTYKEIYTELKEKIEKDYGSRCKKYYAGCIVCDLHHMLDILKTCLLYEYTKEDK